MLSKNPKRHAIPYPSMEKEGENKDRVLQELTNRGSVGLNTCYFSYPKKYILTCAEKLNAIKRKSTERNLERLL